MTKLNQCLSRAPFSNIKYTVRVSNKDFITTERGAIR
jgi:hypothetical protein